MFVVLQNAIIL